MRKKQILLINDIAGYGKVATAAMLPILSYLGHPVYNLPTALVSNTLDYGKFRILETTDYIKEVFPIWKELGFQYDSIATGFIASERQAKLISAYCREQAATGTMIFVDPIMGDEGKLYNGVTPYNAKGVTKGEGFELIKKLRQIGTKSVLITSVPIDGQPSVIGYNHRNDKYFNLPYNEIPVHFPGTGDIFSAILIGHLLDDKPLIDSTQKAIDGVYKLIELNKENEDKNRGIPLEQYLDIL